MAPLSDARLLGLFREALAEWQIDGFVVWKRRAAEWLRTNLEGQTQKSVAQALHAYVESGGEIDQVRERRHDHQDKYEFHFDFRLTIDGRRTYIETTLDETKSGPTITIVNLHDE